MYLMDCDINNKNENLFELFFDNNLKTEIEEFFSLKIDLYIKC